MIRTIGSILTAIILTATVSADILVTQTSGPTITIARGIPWGNDPSGFNNNFILPNPQNQAICLQVTNNNPSNSHQFTFSFAGTTDRTTTTYTGNTARWVTVYGSTLTIAASSSQTFYVPANGAVNVGLIFTGSVAAGGTPDTADIVGTYISASQACARGNPIPLGTATTAEFQSLNTARYYGSHADTFTNPAANTPILELYNTSGNTLKLYLKSFSINCSAACDVYIGNTQSIGTCSTASITRLFGTPGFILPGAQGLVLNGKQCTVAPPCPAQIIQHIMVPANDTRTVDATGWALGPPGSGTNGFIVCANAFTGNVDVSAYWYEN